MCHCDQQKRIVSEIESRLSVCDSIEQTVDIALQQAEAMRQSILKQAFEGRL
jgi:type I restriction enzyme S subunit